MAKALPLLILLPFTASLLCLLARFLRRLLLAQIVSALAVAGILLILALLRPAIGARAVLTYSMGGWSEPLGIALYLDGLAWTASVMGAVVGLCALLFSFGEKRYESDFYFLFLMLLAGMEGVILTGDLFNMFVFIEIVSISSYLLIAYTLEPKNLWASLRYLLLSSLSIAVFLLGLFLVYRVTGTFSLRLIRDGLDSDLGSVSATTSAPGALKALSLAAAALTTGVGLKAAFVPLHTWLPDAHAAAPHPVSALLSGVMIKISFLAIWRILSALSSTGIQALFYWLGPLTAVLAVVLALCQTDSKRLLAFHSVSQMGLITAAFGAAAGDGSAGLGASLAHIISHSLFKSLLFLSVGAAIHLTGERNLQRSNAKPPTWLMPFFLVGALSISGLPPFNGFVSKTLVISLFKSSPLLATALRLTAVGTAASMIKLSGMFRRSRKEKLSTDQAVATSGQSTLSPFFLIPLSLLALLCLAGGIAPRILIGSLVVPAVGDPPGVLRSVYTAEHLIESGIYLALAAGAYLLIRTRRASRVLKRIKDLRLSLDGSLLLVVAAVVLFVVLGGVLEGDFSPPLFSR
jgi:formate hydrogenlyase subunit 3/multisubunit Na+/H+ antiporter MnhD subunit